MHEQQRTGRHWCATFAFWVTGICPYPDSIYLARFSWEHPVRHNVRTTIPKPVIRKDRPLRRKSAPWHSAVQPLRPQRKNYPSVFVTFRDVAIRREGKGWGIRAYLDCDSTGGAA